jgi:hypothetical protein
MGGLTVSLEGEGLDYDHPTHLLQGLTLFAGAATATRARRPEALLRPTFVTPSL